MSQSRQMWFAVCKTRETELNPFCEVKQNMATKKKTAASSRSKSSAQKSAKKPTKQASAKSASARTKTAKPAKSAKPAKATKGRGAANSAFMKPMNIKEPLAQIVGDKPLPRTEVVKRVWAYIRKNNLQDSKNRRQINADDKLRRVFGNRDNVTMFEMTKLINQNLTD